MTGVIPCTGTTECFYWIQRFSRMTGLIAS